MTDGRLVWWLLVLVGATKERECSKDLVLVTTMHEGRTASLLIRSAERWRMPVRVYYEGTSKYAGKCVETYDLMRLYPWLETFANMSSETVFGAALRNAQGTSRRVKHSRTLTAKAHYIFRKVLALRHGVLASFGRYRVAVWADADVEIRQNFDDRFIRFATSVDVATIHRGLVPSKAKKCVSLRDHYRVQKGSDRALPDTGFISFALTNASRDFVLALAGYYGTPAARRSSCLNDICVYERLVHGDHRSERYHGGSPASDDIGRRRPPEDQVFEADREAAGALLPPELQDETSSAREALEAWIATYIGVDPAVVVPQQKPGTRVTDLREGWFALCPEAIVEEESLAGVYRIDHTRFHPCPGAATFVSPFHLLEYAVHAKGGDVATKLSLGSSQGRRRRRRRPVQRRLGEDDEEPRQRRVGMWRRARTEWLSHPFNRSRSVIGPFLEAANFTGAPLTAVVNSAHDMMHVNFYDLLIDKNFSWGYPDLDPSTRRTTLDSTGYRPCEVDPGALAFQLQLDHDAGCCDDTIRYELEGNIGLGAEISALLKPFSDALHQNQRFLDPVSRRPGCSRDQGDPSSTQRPASSFAKCLDLLPVDRCPPRRQDVNEWPSAREFSRPRPPVDPDDVLPLGRRSHFWMTSQLVGYLLRPNEDRFDRVAALINDIKGTAYFSYGRRRKKAIQRRRVLGLHVRRGDTCLDGGKREISKHKGRTCDDLTVYAARVRGMLQKYKFDALFVATDDADVAAEVKTRSLALFGLTEDRVFLLNPHLDRSKLYGAGYYNQNIKRLSSDDASRDTAALLDDLFVLAHVDGIVAKFTSNVARIALALSNALRGGNCVVPYDSLDASWCADFGRRTGVSVHGDFYC